VWRGVSVPTLERVEAGRRKCVGRGRALANGTRGDRNARTRIGFPVRENRLALKSCISAWQLPFHPGSSTNRMIGAIRVRRVASKHSACVFTRVAEFVVTGRADNRPRDDRWRAIVLR
jgi:hypothetical protein